MGAVVLRRDETYKRPVQYPRHYPPPIETDWGKQKSIISNLLSNALKFTEEGEVKLRIINGAGREEVSFIVSDTGIGIPKDQLPMVFDKFHQVDDSTSKRYSGTGLGLTISKNLMDLLGGRIGVEGELGKGSTVTVIIPVSIFLGGIWQTRKSLWQSTAIRISLLSSRPFWRGRDLK